MMDNQKGMITSLIAAGVVGAAAYGISKGVQNGSFQNMSQKLSNSMNSSTMQDMAKPLQDMLTGGGQAMDQSNSGQNQNQTQSS
ncbi:hypothetical protein [Oceanobacillus sp. J11TS1]|uniref:hypothetical protein n=1 Tax=Oceanobacillus sp. J11TS1 TaxID=2807191 RepID=UPI001B170D9A|nr:hypothetical protein [Oceanobacillus sp. J11TS1]GIO23566.1 hypothetical protein J11TS1_21470 [Oceanobacillus sp. J11TS1]